MTDDIKSLEDQLSQVSDPLQKIPLLNAIARTLEENDSRRALFYGQTAYSLATTPPVAEMVSPELLADTLCTYGVVQLRIGVYELALSKSLEAFHLSQQIDYRNGLTQACLNIGAIYQLLGNYPDALVYILKGLELCQQINDPIQEARALNILGVIYSASGEYVQELKTYQKALQIYQESGLKQKVPVIFNNMSMAYYSMGDFANALLHGWKALQIARELELPFLESAVACSIGEIYLSAGNSIEAMHYFQEGLRLAQQTGNRLEEMYIMLQIGKSYNDLGQSGVALTHLQQALSMAEGLETKSELANCHQELARTYQQQQNFAQAFYHYQQFHHIHELIFNEAADKKLKNLQIIYETETTRKEAEINRLKNIELEKEIAERKRAEAEARRRANEMSVLAEVGREVSAMLDLPALLNRIVTRAKELLKASNAAIFLRQPDKITFKAIVTCGEDASPIASTTFQIGEGISGYTALSGTAQIVNDPAHFPYKKYIEGSRLRERFQPILTAPLLEREEVIGVMTLWRGAGLGDFGSSDRDFLVGLARQTTIAIQNAHLFQEVQDAREAAETANRAKSAFLANMSHELRTPLNAILGFTQLLAKVPNLTPEQQENLAIISRNGDHLLGLINDVLELSKIEAGRVVLQEKAFDLHDLIRGLEDMFHLRAEMKGLQMQIQLSPELPRFVRADAGKLRQVLINLIGNALKFTFAGTITLHVSHQNAPDSFQLTFSVADTGIGIAAEDHKTIFAPFVQLAHHRQNWQGTGLGLAISHQFVRLMGGELTLYSQLDHGTIFQFTIPARLADSVEMAPPTATSQIVGLAPDQPTYRLLVAEDADSNRLLLRQILAPLELEVREAKNGQEAVEMCRQWQPHLVWMDMNMPILNGQEATKQIKSQLGEHAPIIVALTAHAFEEDRMAMLALGCDEFIRKPFRETDIFDVLHRCLNVRFIYRQLQPTLVGEGSGVDLSPAQITNLLTNLSDKWLEQLRQATQEGDVTTTMTLIEQIRSDHPVLAKALTLLAYQFDYDRLLMLIPPKQQRLGAVEVG